MIWFSLASLFCFLTAPLRRFSPIPCVSEWCGSMTAGGARLSGSDQWLPFARGKFEPCAIKTELRVDDPVSKGQSPCQKWLRKCPPCQFLKHGSGFTIFVPGFDHDSNLGMYTVSFPPQWSARWFGFVQGFFPGTFYKNKGIQSLTTNPNHQFGG